MSHLKVMLVGLCTWLVSLGAITTAQAAEQLVVPFSCQTDASSVYARPSQLQNYSIIGKREAAPFTACASDGSDRCRTMMLHRFDIDCDGQRIGWPEFYAAISDVTSGRANIKNNRLLVHVQPQRSRRSTRSRFQPPPSRRPFLVEMPDGFAPVRGTVARFEGGGGARNAPMQATRDPFSSRPQNSLVPPEGLARAKPKAAIVKPKIQTKKKTAQRNIIVVPRDEKPSKTPGEKPAVTKPTIATTSSPQRNVKTVAKPKTTPAKSDSTFKVVKAPPATPKSTSKTNAESKTDTPAIVPTLLNGPKITATDKTDSKREASGEDASLETKKPSSIADLLQDRGAKLRADAKSSPPIQETPFTSAGPEKRTSRAQPSSPTLANTLAVLGIVSGLMLIFAFAAYRLLTPKPSPTQASLPPTRPAAKPKTQAVQAKPPKEPSLASMAQTRVTNATKEDSDPRSSIQKKPIKSDPKPASEKTSLLPAIAIPKQPEPTLDNPEGRVSDFVVPQVTSSLSQAAKANTGKKEPTLSLDTSSTPSKPDKPLPELPMPKLVADKIMQPDFDESALLLPRTRQEALTALGVGESAGEDVIERVVAGLKQCWRPDDSNDKAERKRRLQRMQQIETAWRILSDPQDAASQHAKHHPN